MRDEEWNEVVEVENKGETTEVDANTLQTQMQMASALLKGFEYGVQNCTAKYDARKKVAIAQIEANKESEIEEINRYYDKRMQQGEHIANDISESQKKIAELMDRSMNAESQADRDNANMLIKEEKDRLNQNFKFYSETIKSEQSTRIENSKPRNKGVFGFLRDRFNI